MVLLRLIRRVAVSVLLLLLLASASLNLVAVLSIPVFNTLTWAAELLPSGMSVQERHSRALAAQKDEFRRSLRAQMDRHRAELRQEREQYRREIGRERARAATLEGDVAAEKARSADLNEQLRTTRAERDALKQDPRLRDVTYKGQSRTAREAVADASRRISGRVTASTLRNVGSAAAESLPLLGAAVVASATAYELVDACELVNELHELDVAFNPENAIAGNELCGMRVPTSTELWETVKASPGNAWEQAGGYHSDLPEFAFADTLGAVQLWVRERFGELWADAPGLRRSSGLQ